MSIDTYDFVHLAIHAMGDKIEGKTRLQKVIYFLGIKTGELEELGYRAHYYGPYSGEVAGAVDRLSALGFVDANTTVWGVDGRGFEQYKTTYQLNADGIQIAKDKIAAHPDLWKRIQEGASILKSLGDVDYVKLSVAAKTWFMLERHASEKASVSELKDMAKNFKWNVSEEDIAKAAHVLEALGLAKCESEAGA